MNIIKNISTAMIEKNPAFEFIKNSSENFDKFQATDTSDDTSHIFHIYSPSWAKNKSSGKSLAIVMNIGVTFTRIEKLIAEILEYSMPHPVSYGIDLSDGFPEKYLYDKHIYTIDLSSNAAIHKSIDLFVDNYNKYLEPLRLKIRSPNCFSDELLDTYPISNPLRLLLRRIAWVYLYRSRDEFSFYAKNLNKELIPYTKEIDEMGEEVTFEIRETRKFLGHINRLIAALEARQ